MKWSSRLIDVFWAIPLWYQGLVVTHRATDVAAEQFDRLGEADHQQLTVLPRSGSIAHASLDQLLAQLLALDRCEHTSMPMAATV
ncbi:hypothetical protein GCM10009583_12250 [Ornithinicoccus hortensis]